MLIDTTQTIAEIAYSTASNGILHILTGFLKEVCLARQRFRENYSGQPVFLFKGFGW